MTPGCTTEACEFSDAVDEFSELDVSVVGVSADSIKRHRNFVDKHQLKFMLLSDESTKMLSNYGVWQKKKMCGKEYDGIVRTTLIVAPDGTLKALYPNVKVKGHVEEIKNNIRDLMKQ
jgi:peroxiredoxin Q/BCP